MLTQGQKPVKINVDNVQSIIISAGEPRRSSMTPANQIDTAALPRDKCLVVAAATPLTRNLAPDAELLAEHCRMLLAAGSDGIALFGTTGEGPEFAVHDRRATLEAVVAAGISARRLIVSATALALPDIVELSRHAMDAGVDSVLLMPPCVFRSGITEEGTYRFYASVIERIGRSDLRLCLYHFPDICGVPLKPTLVRRLDENFPGNVAGIKDSGGDLAFTEALIRSFGHLGVYTGTETHVPTAIAVGARGTICGLGNIMPRLMRAVLDAPTAFDGRRLAQLVIPGDAIMSRQSFAASIKAVLAHATGEDAWNRMVPPLNDIPQPERGWMLSDFAAWEMGLPASMRSLTGVEASASNVLPLRRAL
jgi:4-hydroxy-tetrahydrodipicolinate synthase